MLLAEFPEPMPKRMPDTAQAANKSSCVFVVFMQPVVGFQVFADLIFETDFFVNAHAAS